MLKKSSSEIKSSKTIETVYDILATGYFKEVCQYSSPILLYEGEKFPERVRDIFNLLPNEDGIDENLVLTFTLCPKSASYKERTEAYLAYVN